MDFNLAINQILILFIIMFIGLAAKKQKMIDENVQSSISAILVKIGLPALVLASSNFERNNQVLPNMLQILYITLIYYVAIASLGIITAKLLKYKKQTAKVYTSLIVFANVGFMGYPVARAFFQETGVFYASIVNLVFTALLWTYGILLFNSQDRINFKKLVNIGTITAVINIIIFLSGYKLPTAIFTALDMTGKMTIPLAMIFIGATIADINFKNLLNDKKVYIVSILRLLIIPITTGFLLKTAGFNSTVISICTIMAAMPSAATNAIFAREFNSEPLFASVGVFITTLLSIISLPLNIYILTHFVL